MGRKSAAQLSVLACAALLAACGGEATVDNTDPTASVPPLTRPSSDKADATTTQARPTQSVGRDLPGREIEEAPAVQFSAEEQAYLDALAEEGVKVSGVEGPLIGAAIEVCQEGGNGDVIAGAIGGQLVEQKRTELTADAAAALIKDQAKKAYC